MAAMVAIISSKVWFLFIALTVVMVVGSPTTNLMESVDCLLRDCERYFTNADRNNDQFTGKNNRFPFLDILGYLKNTHKNPKFGRVRQVPIRELGWEFPGWGLSHFAKFGIFMGIL